MPTIKVKFRNTSTVQISARERRYSYTAPKGDWEPGDLAVVNSPSSGFTLVEVTSIEPAEYEGNKPVVGMVSLAAYKQAEANRLRREEVLAQLKRADAARSERERFAHLAQVSPEYAALLNELDTLK